MGEAQADLRVKRWRSQAALYGASAALLGVALYRSRHFYEDDAFITLRYARRWIEGAGPTWTDGERVQGYTHALWFLQLSLLGRLGANLHLASRVLGGAYLAGIFVVFRRARASPWAALALATLPGLSAWALAGLETVSFAFWLVVAAALLARVTLAEAPSRHAGTFAGLALAAAGLTRPEGIGVALVGCAWVGLGRGRRALWGVVIGFLLPVLAWEAFSVSYYGDLFANPIRAKITGYPLTQSIHDGLGYLAAASSSWAAAVVASLAVVAASRRSGALWMTAMATPVVGGLLVGGGDHMVGVRLFLPAVVLLLFAAASQGRTTPAWLPAGAFALTAALQAPVALARERPPDLAAALGEIVGRFLEKNLPAGSLAAISAAGSTAYFAPSLRFIDTLGLTDRHIAQRDGPLAVTAWQAMAGHRKGDGAYVLSKQPDVIVLGSVAGYLGVDPREWFLTDFELLDDPAFRRQYKPFAFRLREADKLVPDLYLTAYLRTGSAAASALAANGIRLRGPWITEPRHTASTSTGVGFQPR